MTASTVRGPSAAAIGPGSAVSSPGCTGTGTTRTPSQSAALAKAGCALSGSTSSGRSTSGRESRADFTASMQDSVPPEVNVPAPPAGAPNRSSMAPTTSFSIAATLGNAVGSSMLTALNAVNARCCRADSSGRPCSNT